MKLDRNMSQEEEQLAFYFELGRALVAWSKVENELSRLAGACGSRSRPAIVRAGFLSIENFRSKLQFCDSLVNARESRQDILSAWAALFVKLRGASQKRNVLAHHKPAVFPEGEATRRFSLVQWNRPKNQTRGVAPPGAMCLVNIIEAKETFENLASDVEVFRNVIDRQTKLPAVFPSPAAGRPTTRPTRNLIREALGVPPLPSRK